MRSSTADVRLQPSGAPRCSAACCSAAVTPAFSHVVTGEQYSIMLMLKCIIMSLESFSQAFYIYKFWDFLNTVSGPNIISKSFALRKKARYSLAPFAPLYRLTCTHSGKCSADFQFRSRHHQGAGCGWWWWAQSVG